MNVAAARCGACHGADLETFFTLRNVPANDVMVYHDRAQAAACRRGDIALALCGDCGYVQNVCFDPRLVAYTPACEESQAHSGTFDRFARRFAADLAARFPPATHSVLEVGCGKGEFLALLCEGRDLDGVGVDPAWRPGVAGARLRFVADVIEHHAELLAAADVVLCRHTLEHVAAPLDFLRFLRAGMRDDARFVLDVPNALPLLERGAFWDVYYEHCGYYVADVLARLCASAGFEVERVDTAYGDQFLVLEARPATAPVEQPVAASPRRAVRHFAATAPAAITRWRRWFERAGEQGRRVALWGGGSKAVGLLSALGQGVELECVIDINPRKQGAWLPGSAHPVVAPGAPAARRVEQVLVMNPIYAAEIEAMLRGFGLRPELTCLT